MQIREITASVSRKLSDNHYGSAEACCVMTATLEKGENAETAYAELFSLCKKQVYDRLKPKEKEEETKCQSGIKNSRGAEAATTSK